MPAPTVPISTTVYKLGGSLLSLSHLGPRICRLLDSQQDSRPLLVVGGGEAADLVRRWDREHHLTAESAHWLALAAMTLNEALVQQLLPDSRIVANRHEAHRAWDEGIVPILSADHFLRDEEATCDHPLPHTWEVTSDSIAAWVAIQWPAARMILLKSTSLPHPGAGALVDSYFTHLLPKIRDVRWVNLRADNFIVQPFTDVN